MKRSLPLLCLLFAGISSYAQNSQPTDYKITINGKTLDIGLSQNYTVKTDKGETITFQVTQNNELTFNDEFFSFKYPKEYSIAKTKLDIGVEQFALVTAYGTVFMIQKYSTMNPSSLVDMMLQEVTKESISYGYSARKNDFEKKLLSGHKIVGRTSELKYKDDQQTYTVAAFGGKDEGILVMSILNKDYEEKDEALLKALYNSLTIKRN